MFYLFRNPETGQNTLINFANVTCIEHTEGKDEIMVNYGYANYSRIQAKEADMIFDDLYHSLIKGSQDETLLLPR